VSEINIKEEIYQKIKNIADFLNWSIEQTTEVLLSNEIGGIESDPLSFFEHYLNKDQMLKLIFGPIS